MLPEVEIIVFLLRSSLFKSTSMAVLRTSEVGTAIFSVGLHGDRFQKDAKFNDEFHRSGGGGEATGRNICFVTVINETT
jgi:hypothetical protein